MSIYCSLLCFKNHVIERQQLAIQTIFYIDRRFFWNLSPVTDSDVTLVCLHFAHSCTLPFVFKIQKRGYLVMPREKHASVDIPVSLNFLPTRSGWPHAPLWIPSIATHKHTLYHFVPFVSYLPCIAPCQFQDQLYTLESLEDFMYLSSCYHVSSGVCLHRSFFCPVLRV